MPSFFCLNYINVAGLQKIFNLKSLDSMSLICLTHHLHYYLLDLTLFNILF